MDLTHSNELPCPVPKKLLTDNPGFETLLWNLETNLEFNGSSISTQQIVTEKHDQSNSSAQKFLEQKCVRDCLMRVLVNEVQTARDEGIEPDPRAEDVIRLLSVLNIHNTPPYKSFYSNSKLSIPEIGDSHKEYIQFLMPKLSHRIFDLGRIVFGVILMKRKDKVTPAALNYAATMVKKDVKSLESFPREHYQLLLNVWGKVVAFKEKMSRLFEKLGDVDKEIVKVDHFCLKGQLLIKKLEITELRLLLATYTPKTVQALKILQENADRKNTVIKKEIEELQEEIKEYQANKDELEPLVRKYRELKKSLDHLEWAMAQFTATGKTE